MRLAFETVPIGLVAFSSLISRGVRLTLLFKMPQPWTDTYSFQTDFYFIFYSNWSRKGVCGASHLFPTFTCAARFMSFVFVFASPHKKFQSRHRRFSIAPASFCIRSNAINREQNRLNCVIRMCVCVCANCEVCAGCSVVRTTRWIFISLGRILHKPSIIMRNRSGKVSISFMFHFRIQPPFVCVCVLRVCGHGECHTLDA